MSQENPSQDRTSETLDPSPTLEDTAWRSHFDLPLHPNHLLETNCPGCGEMIIPDLDDRKLSTLNIGNSNLPTVFGCVCHVCDHLWEEKIVIRVSVENSYEYYFSLPEPRASQVHNDTKKLQDIIARSPIDAKVVNLISNAGGHDVFVYFDKKLDADEKAILDQIITSLSETQTKKTNMIFKFPTLPEENKLALRKWLKTQRHQYLAQHYEYAACGNIEEAIKHQHYADCFNYILMMEEYHTDEPSAVETNFHPNNTSKSLPSKSDVSK